MSEKIPKIILDGTMRGVKNSPEPAGAIEELIDQKLVSAIADYIHAAKARKEAEIDYGIQGAIANTHAYKSGAVLETLYKAVAAQEQAEQKIMEALKEPYVQPSSLQNSDPAKVEKFKGALDLSVLASTLEKYKIT